MMGQLPGGQQRLFYSFNLEDHVPAQHLLRSIDQCLDLSDLRAYLADFYSPIGRPSIDPELMVRMLVVGYCYGIRSERRLCEEVRIPRSSGHPFHEHLATDSTVIRPPIPRASGH